MIASSSLPHFLISDVASAEGPQFRIVVAHIKIQTHAPSNSELAAE
jgi:hypothetical protein